MNESNDPVTVGAYLIVRKIGAGGLGTVYEAAARRNSGDVSRGDRVAVKVVHEHLASDEKYRSLFDREGRVAQSLNADNVVRVLDYGDEDGRPYQVFEYLPFSIADLLNEHGGMGAGQVRRLAADVGRALQEASEKGIVHRDLSPGNILLTEQGSAKIADYGGANIHAHSQATGGSLGNPAYASPEHFGGADVDVRSDMYSLGLILFHALTGKPAFEATNPMAMKSLQESSPLPALPDTVPPELAAIVQRLTQKDPAARFQTPADLLLALQQTGTPPEGTPRPVAAPVAPPEDATQIAASPVAPAPPAPAEDATQVVSSPVAPAVAPSVAPAVIEPPSEGQPLWRRTPVLAGVGAALAVIVVAVLVIALSGGEDAAPVEAATPAPQPQATAIVATPVAVPTPEPSVVLTISGDGGGTLVVNDFGHGSLDVIVPAGSGTEVAEIGYTFVHAVPIADGQLGTPMTFAAPLTDPSDLLAQLGGSGVAISAFQLNATNGAGDDVTFDSENPLLIEATFTAEALDLAGGNRARLVLLRFDVASGEWEQAGCGPLTGTNNAVQCSVTQLSPWIVAVLENAPDVATPTPTATAAPTRTATPTATATATATPPPVAAPTNAVIACSPDPVLLNAQVTCTVTVDGQANSFLWTADPGDPAAGAGTSFTTTFSTGIAGKGNIAVSVCNSGGCTQASYSVGLIFVEAPPPPTVTPVAQAPEAPQIEVPEEPVICCFQIIEPCLFCLDPVFSP